MTTFLSRSAWTTTSAKGSTLTGSSLVGVAVHWPGTTQGAIGVQSQSATAARIKGYRDFHVGTRGWSDIGYNFAIDQAGRVWQCRTTSWAGNRVGAHCASATNPNANHKYIGVLLILGQSEQPSAAMVEAFRDWYHTRFLPVWKGRTDVRGHGQVPGAQTNCPGTRAKAKIADGTLTSGPTPTPPPPEDDMEIDDRVTLTPGTQSNLGGHETVSVGGLLGYAGAGGFQYINDRTGLLTAQATSLTELAAIKTAVGGQVDEAALAQQIAALLIPVISSEFEGLPGVTLEAIEAANERATRRVLGSLDA